MNSAVFPAAPDPDRARAVAALRDAVPDGAAAVSAACAERSTDDVVLQGVGTMSSGGFHQVVPLRAPEPQGPAVEILGDELLAVRSEFEADGTETSSVFETRVGQLCCALETRGASTEGTQFAATVEGWARTVTTRWSADPEGRGAERSIEVWAVRQIDEGVFLAEARQSNAEAHFLALARKAKLPSSEIMRQLRLISGIFARANRANLALTTWEGTCQ